MRAVVAGATLTLWLGSAAWAAGPGPARVERCWQPVAARHVAIGSEPDPDSDGPPAPPAEVATAADAELAPKKRAWEAALGGREAAKLRIQARLVGWPSVLHVDPSTLPADDEAFLWRVARDTWQGLAELSDRENGLPIDHVRFQGDGEPSEAEIGDYTTAASAGLHLTAIVAAHELGFVSHEQALAMLRRELATLERLEAHRGFLFNFYDTTTLERTSQFVSFVDAAWLAAGLMVVRQAIPELASMATRLLAERDFGVFWDPRHQQMSHGFYVDGRGRSPYHYATLYTEARVGSLIAIGKGDVPASHWFHMLRTFPPACDWQSQVPKGRHRKQVGDQVTQGGWYEWEGLRYVPSWGGSMFEALMPTLFVDERAFAPKSLGRNDEVHVEVQRRWASEQRGWSVWGFSPALAPGPDGYREYGVRPLAVSKGYSDAAVTPHAAALALAVDPASATAALHELARRFPIYGEYGFYDSVDPASGEVATAYLALDQGMLFLAVANHLKGGFIQHLFASDPIAARVLPMLAREDFFD